MDQSMYPAAVGAQNRLREVDKSLTVGYYPQAPGTAGALLRQDLSDLLPSLDYKLADAKFWTNIFKQTIHSTTYEWDVIKSWGYQRPEARFQGEIARPRPDTAEVDRTSARVATMGILGQVSDTAKRVNLLVDPMLHETRTQTMALLKSINWLGYYGDTSTMPLGFNGLRKSIQNLSPASNRIDCKGAMVTLDQIDQGLSTLRDQPNYGGDADSIHFNPKVLAAFNRTYAPQGRFDLLDPTAPRGLNIALDRFRSVVGNVKLEDTTFIQPGSNGTYSSQQDSAKAPQAPTLGTPTVGAPGAGQTSSFEGSDAGNMLYAVQAFNASGCSPLVTAQASVNVAQGDVVSIPITGGAGPQADGFLILRYPTNANSGTPWEIGSIANAQGPSGPATVTFTDDNSRRPNCTEAFILDFNPETMFWGSLCALEREELAKVQTATEFMLTIQGVFCLRAPGRVLMLENIGMPTL